mgnify:CR=1 FL=1
MATTESQTTQNDKVSLPTLTAMVVGSMIGSGVFLLPRRFGTETGVLGALIAWAIAGTGMLMLAFVFQRLATRKPDLDAGIFAYAKAGFGDYVGFNSAFGFWASACAGNTSYWVLIMATTSALFPALGAGDTLPAVICASAGVWLFCFLILRGVKEAAVINRIATVAKIVPIVVFILVALVAASVASFAQTADEAFTRLAADSYSDTARAVEILVSTAHPNAALIVEALTPELQARGRLRRNHEASTLRGLLGQPDPLPAQKKVTPSRNERLQPGHVGNITTNTLT